MCMNVHLVNGTEDASLPFSSYWLLHFLSPSSLLNLSSSFCALCACLLMSLYVLVCMPSRVARMRRTRTVGNHNAELSLSSFASPLLDPRLGTQSGDSFAYALAPTVTTTAVSASPSCSTNTTTVAASHSSRQHKIHDSPSRNSAQHSVVARARNESPPPTPPQVTSEQQKPVTDPTQHQAARQPCCFAAPLSTVSVSQKHRPLASEPTKFEHSLPHRYSCTSSLDSTSFASSSPFVSDASDSGLDHQASSSTSGSSGDRLAVSSTSLAQSQRFPLSTTVSESPHSQPNSITTTTPVTTGAINSFSNPDFAQSTNSPLDLLYLPPLLVSRPASEPIGPFVSAFGTARSGPSLTQTRAPTPCPFPGGPFTQAPCYSGHQPSPSALLAVRDSSWLKLPVCPSLLDSALSCPGRSLYESGSTPDWLGKLDADSTGPGDTVKGEPLAEDCQTAVGQVCPCAHPRSNVRVDRGFVTVCYDFLKVSCLLPIVSSCCFFTILNLPIRLIKMLDIVELIS
ncbi:unnamed protein product [Protopolystoma xenopodis]|uniref:Uncharacterized protein n=1 Tax=Protopolystoma xenopodis TaxID=117903 RepID=A0A3S5B4E4_9PLAT|nr:unnamed protein product [Protopolystoma xenopodis]